MDLATKECGVLIKPTAKENLYTLMVMSMKESGKMIELTVEEPTSMPMEPITMVIGLRISSMVMELNHGPTVQSTKGSTRMAKKMVKANSHLLMVVTTKVNSDKMKFQALVNISGLMEKPMKESGRRTK